MRKTTAITLAALLAACADTIPGPTTPENEVPVRTISERRPSQEEPGLTGMITYQTESAQIYISPEGEPSNEEPELGEVPGSEPNQCENAKYALEGRIVFPRDIYRVGSDVENHPGYAEITNYGDPLGPLMLVTLWSEHQPEPISTIAFAAGLRTNESLRMVLDGGGCEWSEADGWVRMHCGPGFHEPGSYVYELHAFDCTCIRERTGLESCTGSWDMDLPELLGYYHALRLTETLAYDSQPLSAIGNVVR